MLRLREYFYDQANSITNKLNNPFKIKSDQTPPPHRELALETYIKFMRGDLSHIGPGVQTSCKRQCNQSRK